MAEHQSVASPALSAAPRGDSIPCVNSVFEQPWWLNAVAPGAWAAAEVRRGDEVIARLPYVCSARFGSRRIVQPPLTQTLGPWLAAIPGKYARRLETEKKLLGELIEQLPPFAFMRQSLSPALTNWLPFYWAGFNATVNYTYRIEDLTDLDRVQHEFQEQVRRGIRKGLAAVEVDHDLPLDELMRLEAASRARRGARLSERDARVRQLDAACAARGARRILGAVDARGRIHAALYVVWDERTLYAIVNARDPETQAFGANTLLYWEAIRLASQVARVFDFEGSMLEPVEHFFRGFGGRQTPYLSVSRATLPAELALGARAGWRRVRASRRRG